MSEVAINRVLEFMSESRRATIIHTHEGETMIEPCLYGWIKNLRLN
jgi:hypothetical protein